MRTALLLPVHFFNWTQSSFFKVAIKRGQTKLAWSLPSVSNFGRRPIFKVAIKRGQPKLAWSLPSVSNFGRRPIFNLRVEISEIRKKG